VNKYNVHNSSLLHFIDMSDILENDI